MKKFHYAWVVLIAVFTMMGFTRGGVNGAASLFLSPVSQDLGIGMAQLTLYFSVSSIVTILFLPFAGQILQKFDVRLVLVTAVILQAGSFAAFGLMHVVWGWYILAVPMAIGTAFVCTIAGPVIVNNWFEKNNGMAVGIMMAAVGLFGAVLQPWTGSLIANFGWRQGYIILGLTTIIVSVPLILLFIRIKPSQKGMLPYGHEEKHTASATSQQPLVLCGVAMVDARKTSSFYILMLFFFFCSSIACFLQYVAPYAAELGYSVTFAGSAMGAFMFGMFIGAVIFGMLSDKIGARNTAVFAMLCGLCAIILLLYFGRVASLFLVSIGIFGIFSASIGTLGPLLTKAIFGDKDYGQIFSTLSTGLAIAGVVAIPGYGLIFDLTKSYTAALYVLLFMFIVNIGCVIAAFAGKKKMEKQGLWA